MKRRRKHTRTIVTEETRIQYECKERDMHFLSFSDIHFVIRPHVHGEFPEQFLADLLRFGLKEKIDYVKSSCTSGKYTRKPLTYTQFLQELDRINNEKDFAARIFLKDEHEYIIEERYGKKKE